MTTFFHNHILGVCKICQQTSSTISNGLLRLDTYRALSSEAFLWLATKDPLLAAINLAEDLECCIEADSDHKVNFSLLDKSWIPLMNIL